MKIICHVKKKLIGHNDHIPSSRSRLENTQNRAQLNQNKTFWDVDIFNTFE